MTLYKSYRALEFLLPDPLRWITQVYDPEPLPEIIDHLIERDLVVPEMCFQFDITPRMRKTIVEWMTQVCRVYFDSRVLWASVSLLDRYLAIETIMRDRFQLISMVCMWIASKFEDDDTRDVKFFEWLCKSSYSKDEILAAERDVLSTLKYDVSYSTPHEFVALLGLDLDYLINKTIVRQHSFSALEIAGACVCIHLDEWPRRLDRILPKPDAAIEFVKECNE